MDKKSSLVMTALVLATLFLAACRTAITTSKEIDCRTREILCVGLVTSLGGVKDKSFNQMAWEGIQKAQAEKVAHKIQYIETIDAKDYEANIATLVDAGQIKPVVSTVLPLQQARQAHGIIEGRHGRGKIVLQVLPE